MIYRLTSYYVYYLLAVLSVQRFCYFVLFYKTLCANIGRLLFWYPLVAIYGDQVRISILRDEYFTGFV
jgi:hypothetical protein